MSAFFHFACLVCAPQHRNITFLRQSCKMQALLLPLRTACFCSQITVLPFLSPDPSYRRVREELPRHLTKDAAMLWLSIVPEHENMWENEQPKVQPTRDLQTFPARTHIHKAQVEAAEDKSFLWDFYHIFFQPRSALFQSLRRTMRPLSSLVPFFFFFFQAVETNSLLGEDLCKRRSCYLASVIWQCSQGNKAPLEGRALYPVLYMLQPLQHILLPPLQHILLPLVMLGKLESLNSARLS